MRRDYPAGFTEAWLITLGRDYSPLHLETDPCFSQDIDIVLFFTLSWRLILTRMVRELRSCVRDVSVFVKLRWCFCVLYRYLINRALHTSN